MKKLYLFLALPLLAFPGAGRAQTSADSAAVMRAGWDYIEGFYEGDVEKLKRSVRPDVAKFGFSRNRETGQHTISPMSYAQFLSYAERVKSRGGTTGEQATIKDVRILDIMNQIATVKITAWWGTDYLNIGKFDGQWMIAHVIWQSPPPKP